MFTNVPLIFLYKHLKVEEISSKKKKNRKKERKKIKGNELIDIREVKFNILQEVNLKISRWIVG